MESNGFICLVPAFVTILIAITTHRVATAVFFGIVSAAFVKVGGFSSSAVELIFEYLKLSFTNIERLKICAFLIFVGFTIDLIDVSGGYKAFSKWISRYLTSARKTRVTTFLLSLCFFVDDYANVLVCGASMRGMAKPHNISPALLAYLVDRTATVASIIVISTWAAFESSIMIGAAENVNLSKNASEFFFATLPFHISTYLGLLLVIYTAWQGKWFGAYFDKGEGFDSLSKNSVNKDSANKESKTDKVATIKTPTTEKDKHAGSVANLITPILVLVTTGSLLFCYFSISTYFKAAIKPTLLNVLGELPTVKILIFSSIMGWLSSLFLIKKADKLPISKVLMAHKSGFLKMVSPAMVIILAKGLSVASSQIGVGNFISVGIGKYLIVELIPAAVFLISLLITVATGFSWSSMVIVMPIAFELGVSNVFPGKLPIVAGAVISGAISGALMVPYSDKTVLTAAAFNISPMYHAKTQFIQAIITTVATMLFYLFYGYGKGYNLSLFAGIIFITLLQLAFAKKDKLVVYDGNQKQNWR